MYIISKFKDYYDSALGHTGVDKTTVFVRHTEEIEMTKDFTHKFLKNKYLSLFKVPNSDWSMEIGTVFFCGKPYPFYRFHSIAETEHSFNKIKKTFFYHNIEDMKEMFTKKYLSSNGRSSKYQYSYEDFYEVMVKNMEEYISEMKDNESIHTEYQTPIVVVSKMYGRYHKPTITKNPRLIDYEFYKIKDTYQTFQDINMYLNGPLCNIQEKEPEPLDEKHSLMRHGMDKWSFKKIGKKSKL